MSQLPDPAPSAVTVARRLLVKDAAKALIQAQALLAKDPKALEVQFLLGAAERRTGNLEGAYERLTALAQAHPQAWGLRFEAGAALALLGRPALAVPYLAQACRLNPGSSLARHALGDQLVLLGQNAAAAEAHDHPLPGSISDLGLHNAALELFDRTDPAAEARLGEHFNLHLNDPLAVCLIADVGLRLDRAKGVEILVAEQLNRGATFAPLRQRLAMALFRQHRWADALAQIERTLASAPGSKLARELQAASLVQLGGYEKALSVYEGLIRETPKRPDLWLSYGHVLKTMGRQMQSVEAYRRCLNLEPASGDAYWGLANLKVVPFTNADVAQMRTALQSATLSQPGRTSLHYAMGKALEDRRAYQEAFDHYSRGAALANAAAPFDVGAHRALIARQIEIFTAAFFEARKGSGATDKGPIFIVGLPRSGSTLVEQILAGHSEVEGLSELADLTVMARSLQSGSSSASYPSLLGELAPQALETLGQSYLLGAHAYRKSDRPSFVDKFPGNSCRLDLSNLRFPTRGSLMFAADPWLAAYPSSSGTSPKVKIIAIR